MAAYQDSLPGVAVGSGTVIVQPTLYGSGSGDWTTVQWALADGTPTPWLDGCSVVIAAGSCLNITGLVNVTAITFEGDATIAGGGTLALSSGSINVLAGTATIEAQITANGAVVKDGPGTLDLLSPLATAPAIVGGQAIGPGAVFGSTGQSLDAIDPAMFSLVQSLFVDQAIDRTDMIQILQSAVVDGGVSHEPLDALKTLTTPQNEARLNVPDYVAVLASDVVDGNPANANYQGQPLGDLADQGSDRRSRATALERLDGQVVLWHGPAGRFRPASPTAWSPGRSSATTRIQALDVPEFERTMAQGAIGDCYLIAALGAMADSSPAAIENMIIRQRRRERNADWTVRFYYENATGVMWPIT